MAANHVTLIGNLVDDPELRFTPSGVAMAKVRFAVNRRWQDKNGAWQEGHQLFGGHPMEDAAENAAESLTKGAVIVTGRLEQRSWETQEGEALDGRGGHRRDRPLAALGDSDGDPFGSRREQFRWWQRSRRCVSRYARRGGPRRVGSRRGSVLIRFRLPGGLMPERRTHRASPSGTPSGCVAGRSSPRSV